MAPAPILGDGFTRWPIRSLARTGRDHRVPGGPWTASLLPPESRMNFRDPQPRSRPRGQIRENWTDEQADDQSWPRGTMLLSDTMRTQKGPACAGPYKLLIFGCGGPKPPRVDSAKCTHMSCMCAPTEALLDLEVAAKKIGATAPVEGGPRPYQRAGLRWAPATTWGLATTPDSLINGGPLRPGWSVL